MRNLILTLFILAWAHAAVYANGTWTPTDYSGNTRGLAGAAGDTSTFARAHIDTIAGTLVGLRSAISDSARGAASDTATALRTLLRADMSDTARTAASDTAAALRAAMSDTVRQQAIPDSLAGYGGPARLADVERITVRADSATVRILDTTWTATSSSKLIAVNMHNPNQMGWYRGTPPRLTSSLQAFRTAELNNSMWRDEGIRLPNYFLATLTDGGDSLEVWDLVAGTKAFWWKQASSAQLPAVATDLEFADGVFALSGTGVQLLDLWRDAALQYTTSGFYAHANPISTRNTASGYTIMSASPAIVNNTCHAIAVTRSPFLGAAGQDVFGRQRMYWAVGTAGGATAARYGADGTLYLYDETGTSPVSNVLLGPRSFWNSVNATEDRLEYSRTPFDLTGDGWDATDNVWRYVTQANLPLNINVSGIAELPGASTLGRNYPRGFISSNSGAALNQLLIVDAGHGSNSSAVRQVITNTYVSPVLMGDVAVAFSPASSAQIMGAFSTAGTAGSYVVTANGPLSHAWRFDGTTNVVRVLDDDALTKSTGFSIYGWIKTDGSSSSQVIVDKYSSAGPEFRLFMLNTEQLHFAVYDSSASARIGRMWSTAVPIGKWVQYAVTYNGGATSAAIDIYVNGEVVDDTDYNSGSGFASIENEGTDVSIGGTATAGSLFDGDMTPPVITSTILTAAEIRSRHADGLQFIESPTPDTLYGGGNMNFIAADPIGRRVVVGNGSHVQIRDASGALIDTLMCSECGTIATVDVMPWPWADSLSVAFGGSGGIRYRGTDPKFVDLGNASWPLHSEYLIDGEAVVDSAGTGHFWTWQDAIDALSNVGLERIKALAKQTFHNPITSVTKRMILDGAGSLITNVNSTSDEAITVNGDSVTVRNLRAYTAPGGSGGNEEAVLWTGASGIAENVEVLDADDDAFDVSGRWFRGSNLRVIDADDDALVWGAARGSLVGPVFSSGGSSVVFLAAADSNKVIGGDLGGNVHAASGATRNTIVGTIYGALEDYGTGTDTDSGNP